MDSGSAPLSRLSRGAQFGEYQIDEFLGEGAAGTVYRAHQLSLGRCVALKVFSDRGRISSRNLERFLQEGRLAARVRSPRVVQVFEAGEVQGVPFLAYELVSGGTLRGLLARKKRLAAKQALTLAGGCAEALEAIHEVGIVHRDIKPENIFVCSDRGARLGDLGCAKDLVTDSLDTTHGVVLGTPAYVAPETVLGNPPTPASDLYSLGVVAFECLSGNRPFQSPDPAQLMFMHVRSPVPSVSEACPELGPEFDEFFARALAKQPEGRFRSAVEMREALRALLSRGRKTAAVAVGVVFPSKPPRPTRLPLADTLQVRAVPRRWLVTLGIGGLLVVALAGWRQASKAPSPAPGLTRQQPALTPPPRLEERLRELRQSLAVLVSTSAGQEALFRAGGTGPSADSLRQALIREWNSCAERAGSFVFDCLAARRADDAGPARLAGAALVDLLRARQQVRIHYAGVAYAAQERVAGSDLLGLDSLAIWTTLVERGLAELAAVPNRLLARFDVVPNRPSEPLLSAGEACLVAMAHPAKPDRRQARVSTQRVQELTIKGWRELVDRPRRDVFDADVAGALLAALREVGAAATARSLAEQLSARMTEDPGAAGQFDARAQLIRFELDAALVQAVHDPMFFASEDASRRRGYELWVAVRDRLLQCWPWDLRRSQPPASWPGQEPGAVRSLHEAAQERLRLARLFAERLRARLGEPSRPEPGPVSQSFVGPD